MGDHSFEYRIEPGTNVTLIHCGTQVQIEVIERRKDGLTFSGEVRGFIGGGDQEVLPLTNQQLLPGAIVDFRRVHVEYRNN
jgi:hypothetical protein